MKKLILLLALCAPLAVFAQSTLSAPNTAPAQNDGNKSTNDTPPKAADDAAPVQGPVFNLVDEMPEFPGGQNALMQYLTRNIQYPVDAREMGVQGKVYLSFLVDAEGNVKNVQIKRGVFPSIDKEAMRVVKAMPKWKPGKQNGSPVIVQFNLPINFQLQ